MTLSTQSVLTNLSYTSSVSFADSNKERYEIPPRGSITLPSALISYENCYAALSNGTLTISNWSVPATSQIIGNVSTSWTAGNIVLSKMQIGYETDTFKAKIGNGRTPWNSLPYYSLGYTGLVNIPANYSFDSLGNITGLTTNNGYAHDYIHGISAVADLKMKQAVQAIAPITAPSFTETAPTVQLSGTNYYIDSMNGNDSNNGTSPSTPWQNITKLNGLTTANGSIIHLAADGVWTYVDTWANYKTHSTAYFPYNSSDNLRSSSSTAPIVIKPYYPRGSTSSKPQISWYSSLQSTDFTQVTSGGNPTITLNNVWRTPWTTSLNASGFWVMFSNGTKMGVAAIQQVAGQAYGAGGSNPGQLLNYGDVAIDGSYLYICAPSNPVTYFGSVWVTGAYSVFSSFWQGLNYVKFIGLQFNYCSAVTISNASTAPVLGLEIENCTFFNSTALNFNNQNTNASAQMCSCSVHDNVFYNTPYAGIYLSCTSATNAGSSISWQVYRNRLYVGNSFACYGGALLYNQSVGGTNHHAWNNYVFQAKNGTGGNNIDGAALYCDVHSNASVITGNIVEQCGIAIQGNNSIACHITSNLAIDCIAAVRATASSDVNVPGCWYNVQQNTWLWTGRVQPSSIQLSPGSGGINQPVYQEWNDNFTSHGNKFSTYTCCNNVAADLSGTFTGNKKMVTYITSQITTLLVGGNVAGGFGTANIVYDTGAASDVTTTPNYMSIIGTSADALGWFENGIYGSAKLSLDSPLFGAGIPLSIQYTDIKGSTFNNIPTPGCYEQPALRQF